MLANSIFFFLKYFSLFPNKSHLSCRASSSIFSLALNEHLLVKLTSANSELCFYQLSWENSLIFLLSVTSCQYHFTKLCFIMSRISLGSRKFVLDMDSRVTDQSDISGGKQG